MLCSSLYSNILEYAAVRLWFMLILLLVMCEIDLYRRIIMIYIYISVTLQGYFMD